jgi:hypothetical protein
LTYQARAALARLTYHFSGAEHSLDDPDHSRLQECAGNRAVAKFIREPLSMREGGNIWPFVSPAGCSSLEGKVVTCAAHGWRYDVTTGRTLHVPAYGLATYPVKVLDGKILVAIA